MALTQFDSSQLAAFSNTFLGFGRNRILNGDMTIDQQNEGAAVSVNSTSGFFGCDGYQALGQTSDGVFSMQRASATPPTGFQFYQRITTTTADASVGATQQYFFRQIIEGLTIRDFQAGTASAKTFTLSFWVRSSLTGTFGGSVMNGAQNRSYVFNYTINSANTWEQKVITVPGDTSGTWTFDNGAGMRVFWDVGAGANFEGATGSWTTSGLLYRSSGNTRLISTNSATLDLTGVQLELGSTATPFEVRHPEVELALCQRYYEKSYNQGTAVGANGGGSSWSATFALMASNHVQSHQMHFKVTKRTDPTLSFWTPDGATAGSWLFYTSGGTQTTRAVTANHINQSGFDVDNTTASDIYAQGQWAADARL